MLFPARMRKKIASIFFSRGIGVFLLASFFFFTTLTGVASAQTETLPATTSYNVPNTNPDVVQNQHTLVQSVMIEVISAAMCQLTGVDMIDPTHGCLGIDMTTHKLGYAPVEERSQNGGLLGMMGNMIGATYDAPVHTGEFVHYIASSFTPTHSAYAQSATEGFARLTPLLNVWRVFRNVAYLVLVLVFVLVGLGIMLRTKIDPRTVMSVQNQLPKIVVGILLITFSYAIAGLLVDTMWTATYLGINIVGSAARPCTDAQAKENGCLAMDEINNNLLTNPIGFFEATQGGGRLGIYGLSKDIAGNVGDIIAGIFSTDITNKLTGGQAIKCAAIATVPILGAIIGGATGDLQTCAGIAFWGILKYISATIAFFIIAIALYITLFRVWWMLLKAYAYVVIYTSLAPFYILAGLIPGSSTNFTSWLRGLLANLLSFPVVALLFLLARIFAIEFSVPSSFVPPLSGNPNGGSGAGYIIAFAIILITPEIVNILRDMLKSPPNKRTTDAIFGGVSRGTGVVTAGAGAIGSRAWKVDQQGVARGPVSQLFYNKQFRGKFGAPLRKIQSGLATLQGVRGVGSRDEYNTVYKVGTNKQENFNPKTDTNAATQRATSSASGHSGTGPTQIVDNAENRNESDA